MSCDEKVIMPVSADQGRSDESIKKVALVTVTAASFLTPFMGSAVNLAIPAISQELNGSAYLMSWMVSVYLLASAAFLLPFGRLADIVGRKKIFALGVGGFSVFSFLCGTVHSIQALIVIRFLQGLSGAMIFGTGMAILTSIYPPQERGKVLGINSAVVYIGLSLGPVLGGAMNHYLGWRSIFYFIAPIGILVIALTTTKLPGEWGGAKGEKFDAAGSLLYIVGLISFIYGLSAVAESAPAKYILVFGLLVIGLFIRQQKNRLSPLLNLKLFSQNTTFAFSNLAALINYSATFAVNFLISLHLQITMGLNSQTAGMILLSQPVIMALLSTYAGKLSDQIEPRLVASWGMGIVTVGLLWLIFLNETTSIWLVLANLMFLGVGFALFAPPNNNAIMGSVEKRFYGVASSTLGTMRLTGQAISMAIVTLVMAVYVGNVQLSQEYAPLLIKTMRITFTIFTILSAGGILASLARGNMAKKINLQNKG